MYPTLFTIRGFPVSTFGLMMAVAFIVGTWITSLRMREEGMDPEKASTMMLYAMAGGVLGAKLYFAVDVSLREHRPFTDLFFSRDGITWYGGLIGGTLAVLVGAKLHDVDWLRLTACAAPALPVGQALGRVGCFLVGDDYGRPSTLPWAVAFPQGAPPTSPGVRVHPTQLYEIAWLLPVAAFLWWRRKRSPFLLGEYLALNGIGRIAVEAWRVNPRVALGLTEPQWIGIGLVVIGMGGWLHYRRVQLRAAEA
jgi:phosphatidylglycerol---prolipoprotein diacylglyceryl transferase